MNAQTKRSVCFLVFSRESSGRHSCFSRVFAVRAIGLLTLVLLVVSYLAFVWDTTPSESQENSTGPDVEQVHWVRTSDGWEKASTWMPLPPVYQPPLHPLVIAGLQGMLSLAALLAFPGRAKQEATAKACPKCEKCEA